MRRSPYYDECKTCKLWEFFKSHPQIDCMGSVSQDFCMASPSYNTSQVPQVNEYLLKENTELKDKLNRIERKCKFDFVDLLHDVENESKQEKQLTEAKGHIKQLLDCLKQDTNDPQTNYYVCKYMDEAEQFLKDAGKKRGSD